MTSSSRYAIVGSGVVAAALLLLWPMLDPLARQGIVIAALVALPVQIVSFSLLVRFRDRVRGFLAAWVGGTVARVVAIATVAFFVLRSSAEGALTVLVALAAFLFALLLLEPIYFKGSSRDVG